MTPDVSALLCFLLWPMEYARITWHSREERTVAVASHTLCAAILIGPITHWPLALPWVAGICLSVWTRRDPWFHIGSFFSGGWYIGPVAVYLYANPLTNPWNLLILPFLGLGTLWVWTRPYLRPAHWTPSKWQRIADFAFSTPGLLTLWLTTALYAGYLISRSL